jgi:hypothetical protein
MIRNRTDRSDKYLINDRKLKEIKSNVYCEVSANKFLVYSFTHNTFAVVDILKMEVAACTIGDIESNQVVEIVFSEPPTHFWYTDRENQVHCR